MSDFFKQFKPVNVSQQSDAKQLISKIIGLTMANLDNAVVDDICKMIEEDRREGIDGYVLCLSRVLRHDVAQDLIKKAFESKNEKPPAKYKLIFDTDVAQNQSFFPLE